MAPSVAKSLLKEMRTLEAKPLEGVKVFLNEADLTDLVAEITGPGELLRPRRPPPARPCARAHSRATLADLHPRTPAQMRRPLRAGCTR